MTRTRRQAYDQLLARLDVHPVLVDIGSSGEPPTVWQGIARHSIYVGFDPDLREIYELPDGRFHQAIMVNEAVTSDKTSDQSLFYLTRSPYCSSTLKPDLASLSNFLFSDLFIVERETTVRAATLDSVLERLDLPRIDWLKTDSQGTDLRLFNSLKEETRERVLAIDVEPGLVHGYVGEDLFVDVHRDLTGNGFWLSDLNVCGALRMRKGALEYATGVDRKLDQPFLEGHLKKTPAWCEARYLRTIEWLGREMFERRDFALLWTFAILDSQLGFALDLTLAYDERFGSDDISRLMKEETVSLIRNSRMRNPRPKPSLKAKAKSLVPARAKRWIKDKFGLTGGRVKRAT